ncbi:hypothetical protein PVA44_06935 (plasmid) [Entomospira nematocerorum]|uniref:Uncharacterized protein n=1 Tax=Entomospira nematocerorum TaxID=2719987 RepID=A0A968KTR1_9SPIO|nr:hypothetical protein [Entomospira nematocera]NIZ47641.1 hypothetical protein [Entomospira nematocera]WDI34534.1 hypothetical protein PVA44_06935 [Entomospira nematocera]
MHSRTSEIILNFIAILYFIVFMSLFIVVLAVLPSMTWSNIKMIRSTGFSMPNNDVVVMLAMSAFFMGLASWIPGLRRIYKKLPWLMAFFKIFFFNSLLFIIALYVMNYGYSVIDAHRNTIFYILTLCILVAGRLLLGLYAMSHSIERIGEIEP